MQQVVSAFFTVVASSSLDALHLVIMLNTLSDITLRTGESSHWAVT